MRTPVIPFPAPAAPFGSGRRHHLGVSIPRSLRGDSDGSGGSRRRHPSEVQSTGLVIAATADAGASWTFNDSAQSFMGRVGSAIRFATASPSRCRTSSARRRRVHGGRGYGHDSSGMLGTGDGGATWQFLALPSGWHSRRGRIAVFGPRRASSIGPLAPLPRSQRFPDLRWWTDLASGEDSGRGLSSSDSPVHRMCSASGVRSPTRSIRIPVQDPVPSCQPRRRGHWSCSRCRCRACGRLSRAVQVERSGRFLGRWDDRSGPEARTGTCSARTWLTSWWSGPASIR